MCVIECQQNKNRLEIREISTFSLQLRSGILCVSTSGVQWT